MLYHDTPVRTLSLLVAATLVTLLLAASCAPGDSVEKASESQATKTAAIVGGELEYGWEGVGALTITYPSWGYMGSFCTATLIDPEWVLTAAHCASSEGSEGYYVWPEAVHFFNGPNARNIEEGGLFFQADAFFIHPAYDAYGEAGHNDVALIHLSEPAEGLPVYPINRTTLDSSYADVDVFYVGYGVTDGDSQSGGGVKRSAYVPIDYVRSSSYVSKYDGTGVCFGDSGGPGLMEFEGEWRVVGVNSAGGNYYGSDPCRGSYIHMRVDAFAEWIDGIMADGDPVCQTKPDMCICEAACQEDGTCDNIACKTMSCSELNDCIRECPDESAACPTGCTLQATYTGYGDLQGMYACLRQRCRGEDDLAYQFCGREKCSRFIDNCLGLPTGEGTCRSVVSCAQKCAPDDWACTSDCLGTSPLATQENAAALLGCAWKRCRFVIEDAYAWETCMWDQCGTDTELCLVADECTLTGGDCPEDTACYVTPVTTTTSCYPSFGGAAGGPCVPGDGRLPRPCADGLTCQQTSVGSLCAPVCMTDADCAADERCAPGAEELAEPFGGCVCIDEDYDGVCLSEDCNDSFAAAAPGLVERCGDGLDNDCNGEIDDGCDTCADADADGYCAPKDCDDEEAAAHPGAGELCDDAIDNDCDGLTDELCDECVDNDADGYCAEVDCHEGYALVNPGQEERCDDGLDNNCDGQTDEGCEVCVDNDADGTCFADDCDDFDALVHPGTPELCNDELDNDCNGLTDDGCDMVPEPQPHNSVSGGGGCSTTGAAGTRPDLAWLLLGLLLLVPTRRR